MDDGVGVTENDEKETEGSMVDVNAPVVEMVTEGVGVMLKSTNIIYYQYLFFKILLRHAYRKKYNA